MKKLKVLTILTFLCLFYTTSNGQENLIPGYIITNKGKKLEGYIDYRNWDRSPNEISFCKDKNDKRQIFISTDLIEIGSNEVIFISANVETEKSSRNLHNLDYDAKFKLVIENVFLEVLFRGEKSLYLYKDKEGRENYYIYNNGKFELLKYKIYLKKFQRYQSTPDHQGWIQTWELKPYVNQLKYYFGNCKKIEKKIEVLKYNRVYLERIFSDYYNKCNSNTVPDFISLKDKVKIEYGIIGGGLITSVKSTSTESYDDHLLPEFSTSKTLGAGIFFNFVLPTGQRKYSFNNELFYNSFRVTNHFEDIKSKDNYKIYDSELAYSYLNLKNFFQIRFQKKQFSYFGKIGISNGLVLTEKNISVVETKFYTTEDTENLSATFSSRKHEFGILAGLGIGYNRFSLEFRYEIGQGMYKSIKTNRMYGLLGIRLSK